MEWDIGAAHAIVNESGGQLIDQKKQQVEMQHKGKITKQLFDCNKLKG